MLVTGANIGQIDIVLTYGDNAEIDLQGWGMAALRRSRLLSDVVSDAATRGGLDLLLPRFHREKPTDRKSFRRPSNLERYWQFWPISMNFRCTYSTVSARTDLVLLSGHSSPSTLDSALDFWTAEPKFPSSRIATWCRRGSRDAFSLRPRFNQR